MAHVHTRIHVRNDGALPSEPESPQRGRADLGQVGLRRRHRCGLRRSDLQIWPNFLHLRPASQLSDHRGCCLHLDRIQHPEGHDLPHLRLGFPGLEERPEALLAGARIRAECLDNRRQPGGALGRPQIAQILLSVQHDDDVDQFVGGRRLGRSHCVAAPGGCRSRCRSRGNDEQDGDRREKDAGATSHGALSPVAAALVGRGAPRPGLPARSHNPPRSVRPRRSPASASRAGATERAE